MDAKSTSKVLLSRDIELQQKRLINERKGLSTPNSSCSSGSMSANSTTQPSRHPATLSELDTSSTTNKDNSNNNTITVNGSGNHSKHSSPVTSPLPQNKRFKRSRPPKPLSIPATPSARRLIPPAMMSAPLRGGLAGGHLASSHHHIGPQQLPYPYQPQVLVSASAAQFPQQMMVSTPVVPIPVHPSALIQQQQQQLIHSKVAARSRTKQFKIIVDDDGKLSIQQQQQQQQPQQFAQQPQPQFAQQPFPIQPYQQAGFYHAVPVPMSANRQVARVNGGDNSTNGSCKNGNSYSMVYSSIREVPIERTPITDVYLEDVKDAPAPSAPATANNDHDKTNNSEVSNSDTTTKEDQQLPSSATSNSSVTAADTPMNEDEDDDEDDVESCAIEDELASPPKTQSKPNSAIPSAKPNALVVNDKTSQQQQQAKKSQPVMIKLGDCVYSFDGVLSREKFVEVMSFVYDNHVKGVS
ncbi:unnamed protein product [Ambrosiozyma monospora]|uniref:Unnamed protein product n=1 Tax=Ambrosiozyma monospora TaxID=43982 RepID=A0A9W6YXA5_AMBMO|nr:unnamed protein product [Ambrosiozyma monospora]